MSETTKEHSGTGRSVEEKSNGQRRSQSEEAFANRRPCDQVENETHSTSPPYWDIDDDDDFGSKPSELFGRHGWEIEKFSEINQRELRSNVFEVGDYKWYILVYPKGFDACNYLSLFLCVANHDELLPGWSHVVQFTLAVANKDPKKSKHSDTLHRFWYKESDWGWKKYMELPKLQEGFLHDSDSLIIKAQIQIIRERVDRPFRCLHVEYRRELFRVYLKNVEQIFGRFVEDKRSKICKLIEDKAKWESGLKALEDKTKNKKSKPRVSDTEETPAPIVIMDKDTFALVDDVLLLLRAAHGPLPLKDEKGCQNRTKDGSAGEEFNRELTIECDETRLTELGKRTVEIFVLTHIFSSKIEVAYQEVIAWRMQEELIREEEEQWLVKSELQAKRGAAEKEKKSKKKQKKNKNRRKEKMKKANVKTQTEEERDIEKQEHVKAKSESLAEKLDTLGDVSDVSDSADILQLDFEDRESSPVHLEIDALEIRPPLSEGTSRGRGSSVSVPNGVAERKYLSTMDDRSHKRHVYQSHQWIKNRKTQPRQVYVAKSLAIQTEDQTSRHAIDHKNQSHSSEIRRVGEADDQKTESPMERNPVNKVDHKTQDKSTPWNLPSLVQAKVEKKDVSNVDVVPHKKVIYARSPSSNQASPSRDIQLQTLGPRANIQKPASQPGPSMSRPLSDPIIPPKQAATVVSAVQTSKTSSACSVSSEGRLVSPTHDQAYIPQSYKHAIVASSGFNHSSSQSAGTSTLPSYLHSPPISVSNHQSGLPINVGSSDVSSGGLLWTGGSILRKDTTSIFGNHAANPYNTYVRPTNVQIGRTTQSLLTDFNHSSSQSIRTTILPPYSHPLPISVPNHQSGFPINVGSMDVSSGGLLWTGDVSSSRNITTTICGNRTTNTCNTHVMPTDVQIARTTQSLMIDEFTHLDIINDLLEEEHGLMDSSVYRVPQWTNNLYSYHGGADHGIPGSSKSYSDEGFHQSYGEYMPHPSSSSSPYGIKQMDTLQLMERLMANIESSLLGMRNQSEASTLTTYSYFDNTHVRPTNVQIGRTTQSVMTDEFPHLDIINDLLEEEQGSMDNSIYRVPQWINNLYSYHGGADLGIPGRSRSYSDEGSHQSYGEYMPCPPSSSPYVNKQMDALKEQTQWHMADMDLSLPGMRKQEKASASTSYFYFDLLSSYINLSAGINGYRDFKPLNGH